MKTPSKPGSPAPGSGPKPASRTATPVSPTDAKPVEVKPPAPAPTTKAKVAKSAPTPAPAKSGSSASPSPAPVIVVEETAATPKATKAFPARKAAKVTEAIAPVPPPSTKAKVAKPAPAPARAKVEPPPSPPPAPVIATEAPTATPKTIKALPTKKVVNAAEAPAPPSTTAKVAKPAPAPAPTKTEPLPSPAPAPVTAAEVPAMTPKATKALPTKKVVKAAEVPAVVPATPAKTKPTKTAPKAVAVTAPVAAILPAKATPKATAKKPKQPLSAKGAAALRPAVTPPVATPSPVAKASAPALELPATLFTLPPSALFSSSTPGAALPPIPPILLEGDHPVKLPGSSSKTPANNPIALAVSAAASAHPTEPPTTATPPAPAVTAPVTPESARRTTGEPKFSAPFPLAGSLWLVARDPFNLCAHWNFDPAILAAYAAENQGAWHLRVWVEMPGAWLAGDQVLPVGVTHRFVPVVMPATRYVAEVGFLAADGSWQGLAVSQPVTTPADAVSMDTEVVLATVAPEPVTPDVLWKLPPDAAAVPHAAFPLLSLPDLAKAAQLTALVWKALSVSGIGNSGEITELVGEHVLLPGGATLGPTAGGPKLPVEVGETLPSSEAVPTPPLPAPRSFWFKVNAEVILYGSTERDAQVTIGGRPVKLRDDGSFSFRFALPDGEFQLPVVAVSAAGDDQRAAKVTFARTTVLQGEVGRHPGDETLRPPTAEAVG